MQADQRDRPDVIALPPLILAATIALGVVLNLILPASFLPNAITAPLGLVVILAAATLAISAIREMLAANTAVDPRRPSTDIVTSGVFRMSRNPIYLGMLLLCAGAGIIANSLWGLALTLPLAVILQKGVIEREEAYLEQKFGDTYMHYKAKVRRWI